MRFLGICDNFNTCDCCGKTDLKCTVAFELEGGGIVYYGRICAQRWSKKPQKVLNEEWRSIKDKANSEACALYCQSQAELDYRAMLEQLNKKVLSFTERWAILKPFSDQVNVVRSAIRKEIAKKYFLKESDLIF